MSASSSSHTLRNVLLATDLSARGDRALERAVAISADRQAHLTVLHAFEEFNESNLTYDRRGAPPPDALERAKLRISEGLHIERFRQTRAIELAEFLASMVLPEEARRRLVTLVELGDPAQLVREDVRDRGADLVVLGTRARGAMLEALLGSTAKSILSSLPCDALVVRAPLRGTPSER